ncbi:hypothetical protein ACJX0J_040274 [Zea mays]
MFVSLSKIEETIFRVCYGGNLLFSFIACETFTCEIDIIMRTLVEDVEHISLEHFTSQIVATMSFSILMIDCLPMYLINLGALNVCFQVHAAARLDHGLIPLDVSNCRRYLMLELQHENSALHVHFHIWH